MAYAQWVALDLLPFALKLAMYFSWCKLGTHWVCRRHMAYGEATFLTGLKCGAGVLGVLVAGVLGSGAGYSRPNLAHFEGPAIWALLYWLEWGLVERFVADDRFTVVRWLGGFTRRSVVWRLTATILSCALDWAALDNMPLSRHA